MKKIILSLFAIMATLGVNAQTTAKEETSEINVIRVYSSERTGDASDYPVAEFQNINSNKYSAKLKKGGIIEIYKNSDSTPLITYTNTSTVKYRVELQKIKTTTDGYDSKSKYVNLGLTSGTLWAKLNVGATLETDCGDYFAWGETSAYNSVPNAYPQNTHEDWTSYENSGYLELIRNSISKNGNQYYWQDYKWSDADLQPSKYFSSTSTNLEDADDAAKVNWNNYWSMPTYDQIDELVGSTNNYELYLNGMPGWRFVNKSDVSRYIFLPSAGILQEGGGATPAHLYNLGSYWSNEIWDASNPCYKYAFDIIFPGDDDPIEVAIYDRSVGESVRPVLSTSTAITLVTSIGLSETASVSLYRTSTLTAPITPSNATYTNVIWSSSDESIATVNALGEVTGVKEGSAVITATATDGSGVKAECNVTVAYVALKSATISSNHDQIDLATPAVMTVTTDPENASYKPITWSSSDETKATVSESGLVRAIDNGDVTITATVTNGITTVKPTYKVTVVVYVDEITLSSTAAKVKVGENVTLTATIKPDNAQDKSVTWSSGNTSVATVDENGVVTGVKAGTAWITARSNDGTNKAASCKVTVTAN